MLSIDDIDFKIFRTTTTMNSFGLLGFFKVLILADLHFAAKQNAFF